MKNKEVMTLSEIARYLKVSEKTVTRMVQAGKIPGAKVASQWRFVRAAIDDWLNARMYALPKKGLLQVINTADEIVPIAELVSPQRIVLNINAGSKEEVLAQLIHSIQGTGIVEDMDEFLAQIIAREEMISTAIGHGLAVPHVRNQGGISVKASCIILGICREGTRFDALDGRKTYVFAVPCTNSDSEHLRMMAKISLIFRKTGIIKKMRSAKDCKEIMAILEETDREIQSGCRRDSEKMQGNAQEKEIIQ